MPVLVFILQINLHNSTVPKGAHSVHSVSTPWPAGRLPLAPYRDGFFCPQCPPHPGPASFKLNIPTRPWAQSVVGLGHVKLVGKVGRVRTERPEHNRDGVDDDIGHGNVGSDILLEARYGEFTVERVCLQLKLERVDTERPTAEKLQGLHVDALKRGQRWGAAESWIQARLGCCRFEIEREEILCSLIFCHACHGRRAAHCQEIFAQIWRLLGGRGEEGEAWLTSNFETSSSSMRDIIIPAMETTADAKLRKMETL
jgi:hypothetical protein